MSSTGRCRCDLHVVHGIIHQKHQRSFEIVEAILIFAFYANFLERAKKCRRDFGFLCMFIHIPTSLSGGGFASASSGTSGSICKKRTTPFVFKKIGPYQF